MTALGLRRVKQLHLRDAVLIAAVLAWAAFLFGAGYGFITPTRSVTVFSVLQFGVPLLLVIAALFVRSEDFRLPLAAGFVCIFLLALMLPTFPTLFVIGIPAMAVAGVLTHRFPTFSLAAVFALTGTYGSITAFTGIVADSVADKFMTGLWVGVIGSLVLGRRRVALNPTPAFFMLGGFLLLTFIALVTSPSFFASLGAFRLGPLYLSLVLLIGYGGFKVRTLDGLARTMVVVCLVVAAYATLRWAIGADAKEEALQRSSLDRQYNRVGTSSEFKVQGSLPNGQSLGLWLSCTIPFTVAIAMSWRGWYRVMALATLPLSVVALLGSSQRAAVAAVIAGSLIVATLNLLARGFRGPRLGVAVAVAVTAVVSASVIYPAVVDDPENRKRYSNILTPTQDGPFQERLHKWRETLAAVRGEPFGFGLGAGNPVSVPQRFSSISTQAIDNSFLMIAYDQGILVMGFFIATMLILLLELLRHSVWTRGPGGAALTAAAAGTLVSMLVEFVGANYIVAPPVVAGWMIVGLGVAQYGVRERAARAPAERQRPALP